MTPADPLPGTSASATLPLAPPDIYWYIGPPDGAMPWLPEGRISFTPDRALQLASELDRVGFHGALIGTGAEDTWMLASRLAAATQKLRFLVATYPMLISPILAARMAQSFEHAAPGRLALNIVNGTSEVALSLGSGLSHQARYALTEEWLPLFRRAVAGEPYAAKGQYLTAEGRMPRLVGSGVPVPELWMAGSSPEALNIAAHHIDRYLSWGEPPAQLGSKLAPLATQAASLGRRPGFGVRLNVILRDSDEAAWDVADTLLRSIPRAELERNATAKAASDSIGMGRMAALYSGRRLDAARELEIEPGLWLGLGLLQFAGNSAAIVGGPETVRRVIDRYRALGISTFILSGLPLLDEAARFAEAVLPGLLSSERT